MRCFSHPDVEAVGTCGCCRKGLCRPCASEGSQAITCGDRCKAALDVVARARSTEYRGTARRVGKSANLLIVLGVGLFAASVWLVPEALQRGFALGGLAAVMYALLRIQVATVFGFRAEAAEESMRGATGPGERGVDRDDA